MAKGIPRKLTVAIPTFVLLCVGLFLSTDTYSQAAPSVVGSWRAVFTVNENDPAYPLSNVVAIHIQQQRGNTFTGVANGLNVSGSVDPTRRGFTARFSDGAGPTDMGGGISKDGRTITGSFVTKTHDRSTHGRFTLTRQ